MNGKPYVKIVEEPASKSTRFRYKCEGRFAGIIPGVNSRFGKKSLPTIQIVNWKGNADVVISCVTKDPPYMPHPHSVVSKVGPYQEEAAGFVKYSVSSFENNGTVPLSVGIQCVKKKDIVEALEHRKAQKIDPFKTGFHHEDKIDLNCVRLCFQVFLHLPKQKYYQLDPVVSEPIYDKKQAADLTIFWVSHHSCSAAGGQEMGIISEKVLKDDIQIRFFQESNNKVVWQAFGELTGVYKQVAVVFKTPMYRDLDIIQPVEVQVQLIRKSNGELSRPVSFTYKPTIHDDFNALKRKRQKCMPDHSMKAAFASRLQEEILKETVGQVGSGNDLPFKVKNAPPFNVSLQTDEFSEYKKRAKSQYAPLHNKIDGIPNLPTNNWNAQQSMSVNGLPNKKVQDPLSFQGMPNFNIAQQHHQHQYYQQQQHQEQMQYSNACGTPQYNMIIQSVNNQLQYPDSSTDYSIQHNQVSSCMQTPSQNNYFNDSNQTDYRAPLQPQQSYENQQNIQSFRIQKITYPIQKMRDQNLKTNYHNEPTENLFGESDNLIDDIFGEMDSKETLRDLDSSDLEVLSGDLSSVSING